MTRQNFLLRFSGSGKKKNALAGYEGIKCCVVELDEILAGENLRLEANIFSDEARNAARNIDGGKFPAIRFAEIARSYTLGRAVRVIKGKSPYPFYQPSDVLNMKPEITGYLWAKKYLDIEELIIHKGQVLLTCSGTIGRAVYVSDGLDNKILSHDMLRIDCNNPEDAGYVYTYLKSPECQKILHAMCYGAVIPHIEAEHLNDIPIPNAPTEIRRKIHALITQSYALRDESNIMLDESESLLVRELGLPPIDSMINYGDILTFEVSSDDFLSSGRFEASYHSPIFREIVNHLEDNAGEVLTLGDERVSRDILLPGRFKRVYVSEGYGAVFIGGKQLGELDPSDKKYLAFSQHEDRIRDELTIHTNMILITCSGTLGNVILVPKHWDNWAVTHDLIRLIPQKGIEGYAWVWLQTDYVKAIINSLSYGAVVKHIEIEHVASVPFPLLRDKEIQSRINSLALCANDKRFQAYNLEREAMKIIEGEILSGA